MAHNEPQNATEAKLQVWLHDEDVAAEDAAWWDRMDVR